MTYPQVFVLGGPQEPETVMLCLPHAGASADVFRPWAARVPDGTAVWSVDYPGRRRSADLPFRGIHELGEVLARQLVETSSLLPAARLVVFGHSMGGLVGYETLARIGNAAHEVTFAVSGCPAPQVRVTQAPPENPQARVRRMLRQGGTAQELLADDAFVAMLSHTMSEDLRACDEYTGPSISIAAPTLVLCALDDPVVDISSVMPWKDCVDDLRGIKFLTGGHMFPFEQAQRVIELILSV